MIEKDNLEEEKLQQSKLKSSKLLLLNTAATGDVLQEKVFLEISQNSQENTRARVSFLIKLQGVVLVSLLFTLNTFHTLF